jgi:hypothetical protein
MKRLQRRWARPHDYDLFDVLMAVALGLFLLLWQGGG